MALGAYAGLATHTLGAIAAFSAVGFTIGTAQAIAIHGTALATGAGIAATGAGVAVTGAAAGPAAAGIGAVAPAAAPVTAAAAGAVIGGKAIKEKIGGKGGFLTDATMKVASFARNPKTRENFKNTFSKGKRVVSGLGDTLKSLKPAGE